MNSSAPLTRLQESGDVAIFSFLLENFGFPADADPAVWLVGAITSGDLPLMRYLLALERVNDVLSILANHISVDRGWLPAALVRHHLAAAKSSPVFSAFAQAAGHASWETARLLIQHLREQHNVSDGFPLSAAVWRVLGKLAAARSGS